MIKFMKNACTTIPTLSGRPPRQLQLLRLSIKLPLLSAIKTIVLLPPVTTKVSHCTKIYKNLQNNLGTRNITQMIMVTSSQHKLHQSLLEAHHIKSRFHRTLSDIQDLTRPPLLLRPVDMAPLRVVQNGQQVLPMLRIGKDQ